jgi:dolichol kinase
MNDAADISLSAELVRKGIHLFALVIPVGYWLVPFPVAVTGVAISALVSIAIDLARFRRWRLWGWLSCILSPIIRDHEFQGGFTGATYILSTSAIVIFLFPKTIAIASIVFIIIGDTAAALVGRTWGRHKLIGRKSMEGSAACLVSLALVSFFIPGLPTPAGLGGAVAATLAEAFSGKVDDNFTVPIVSGLIMLLIMYGMGYEQAVFFSAFR